MADARPKPEPTLVRVHLEDVHWRLVGEEVLLLDERVGRYLALNASGASLWELLLEGATRQQLAERLATEYGIDRVRADGDVDALLGELASRSLLVQQSVGG